LRWGLSLLKNPFGFRLGWQVKITTDDIDDISSVEENVGHSFESGSLHGVWVPVYSSAAIVTRNDHAETGLQVRSPATVHAARRS
jgi:hypothetical protein